MAHEWFDSRGAADGATPEWCSTPPANITIESRGRGIVVHDLRAASAFNTILLRASEQDVDVVIKFRVIRGLSGGSFNNGGIGIYARYADANNFYGFFIGSGGSYASGLWRKRVAGVNTDSTVTFSITGGETGFWRYVRFRCVGTSMQLKAWAATVSEPGTWAYSSADSQIAAAGELRLVLPYSHGGAVEIERIEVATAGDAPATTPHKTISGTVTGDTGSGAARTVHAIRRDTGGLLATTTSAADGTYSLKVSYSGLVDVVVLDDDAGVQYNDVVVGRVTPG